MPLDVNGELSQERWWLRCRGVRGKLCSPGREARTYLVSKNFPVEVGSLSGFVRGRKISHTVEVDQAVHLLTRQSVEPRRLVPHELTNPGQLGVRGASSMAAAALCNPNSRLRSETKSWEILNSFRRPLGLPPAPYPAGQYFLDDFTA